MKLLVIADRPASQKIQKTLSENPDIEMILCLGDLDYFQLVELQNIHHIPKLGIYGNHCSGTYFEPLGIQNMHLQTFIYKGLIFGGFEGCVRYKADPYAKMYTQEQATEMLQNFPKVDITMTHCPPFGINDETEIAHQGFVALRKYLEQYQSKYWLHGHTYPTGSDLVTEFGSTRIIYVSADKVVEIDGELIGQTK